MTEQRYEVHEVHDWPARLVKGPRIVVWYGRDRHEAEKACSRLRQRHEHGTFYYEVVASTPSERSQTQH